MDRWREANSSGCCVRKDNSGCVQVTSHEQCPVSQDIHENNYYYLRNFFLVLLDSLLSLLSFLPSLPPSPLPLLFL